MNIANRIQRSIANRKDGVIVRSELKSFGSPAQVGLALRGLVDRAPWFAWASVCTRKPRPTGATVQAIPTTVMVLQPGLDELGVSLRRPVPQSLQRGDAAHPVRGPARTP